MRERERVETKSVSEIMKMTESVRESGKRVGQIMIDILRKE